MKINKDKFVNNNESCMSTVSETKNQNKPMTENIEQALERAGTKAGNKGWDAALSALEMVDVMNQLRNHK